MLGEVDDDDDDDDGREEMGGRIGGCGSVGRGGDASSLSLP